MSDTSEEFDWFGDEHVIVPEQEAIAIYANTKGAVVIRRMMRWDEEDDPFFLVDPHNAVNVAQAILDAAKSDAWITTPRMAAMMQQRPDINWAAVNRGFTQGPDEGAEARTSSRSERRQLIADAIRKEPTASNRAIAAQCGVSDKTVGTVRAKLGAEFRNESAEIRTEEEEELRLVAAE